jgi:hypothetical protein
MEVYITNKKLSYDIQNINDFKQLWIKQGGTIESDTIDKDSWLHLKNNEGQPIHCIVLIGKLKTNIIPFKGDM